MINLKINTNPKVEEVFHKYPDFVKPKILNLRRLILDTANEIEGINELEETLKWGEPSYIAKKGSTLRIDWKKKTPNQYAMYFKCTSKLVLSFKAVYPNIFKYEGNRAIVFELEDSVPESELKRCIKAALTYHKIKNEPLLGL